MRFAVKQTALIGALATVLAGPLAAQDSGWDYSATIYGWIPALDVTVDTPLGPVDGDMSGSDALSNLDMAFMGTFEARNGRWGFILDAIYSDLSVSNPTPLGVFSDVTVDTKIAAISGYAAYRVYETNDVAIDLGAGFRAFGADVGVALNPGGPSTSDSENWVDPLLAARLAVNFNEDWFGTAFVDFGGTGSDDKTWQSLLSVGYRFNETWSTEFGYRQMDLTHDIGKQSTTINLSGPFIGATARF